LSKPSIAHTAFYWLIAAGALSGLGIANAQITAVAAGTDYLQTGPGTQAKLPFGGGMTVTLKGVPIKSTTGKFGNTDTAIVHQQANFTTGGPSHDTTPTVTVPIRVLALNLEGTVAASSPAGATCTVHVNLAPFPLSTGELMLTVKTPTGGAYTSTLNLNVQITFTPVGAGTTCYPPIPSFPCTMSQGATGVAGTWTTTPQPGEFLVPGPYPDPAANQHSGLPAGFVDFYISGIQTDSAATAEHVTCEALAAPSARCK